MIRRKQQEPDYGQIDALNMTPLDGLAIQMHEMYISLRRAGFDDTQALILVVGMVRSQQ